MKSQSRNNSRNVDKRDTVMISHANPEDNEFALWLGLQLARNGYRVWSDVTKLLGGEQFWADIEEVIRQKAVKVIYVLSKVSNEGGRGFRKELHLADSVGRQLKDTRFLIPIATDDLLPRDYNVYVQQLNTIQFQNWATGLKQLLKALRRDGVPKVNRRYNPNAVSSWWRNFRSAKAGIIFRSDHYYSNWFPIKIPNGLFWHSLESAYGNKITLDFDLPFRFVQSGNGVLTFADEEEVRKSIEPEYQIIASEWLDVNDLSKGKRTPEDSQGPPLKNLFVQLLRETWQVWIEKRPVGIYELSGGSRCAYFIGNPEIDSLKVDFSGVDGKQTWRSLVGSWTRHAANEQVATKAYWHFGVQAKPKLWPALLYQISSHVIFSDDGRTPWESHRRMHKARRSRCKNWYNDEWRDRLSAAMTYLAAPNDKIEIPLCESEALIVPLQAIQFDSKISCRPLPSSSANKSHENAEADIEDDFDEDEEPF